MMKTQKRPVYLGVMFIFLWSIIWLVIGKPLKSEGKKKYRGSGEEMMQKIKTNLLKNNWSESYLLNHNNPSEKTTLMNACFARPSKIFITEDRVYIQLQSTEKPGDIEVSMDVNVYQTSPSEIKYDLFDHLATRWKEVR